MKTRRVTANFKHFFFAFFAMTISSVFYSGDTKAAGGGPTPTYYASTYKSSAPMYKGRASRMGSRGSSYSSAEGAFSGFYSGVQGGFGFGSYLYNTENTPAFSGLGLYLKNFGANIYGGYGRDFNNFYVGGELSVGRYNAHADWYRPTKMTKTKIEWGGFFALRGGMVINPQTLMYLKLGYAFTRFLHNDLEAIQDVEGYPGNIKKNISGVLFGGGVEAKLTENIAFRMEGFYIYHKNFNLVNPDSHIKMSNKLNYARGDIGISYYLNGGSASSTSSAARSEISTGLYIFAGGTASLFDARVVDSTQDNRDWVVRHFASPSYKFSVSGGLGYSYLYNDLYFIAGEVSYPPATGFYKEYDPNPNYLTDSVYKLKTKVDIRVRPGYKVSDKTIAYGILGGSWAKIKHRSIKSHYQRTTNASIALDYDQSVFGAIMGGGFEVGVWEKLSLRLEYAHTHYYGKVLKISPPWAGTAKEEVKPSTNNFLIGVSYTF